MHEYIMAMVVVEREAGRGEVVPGAGSGVGLGEGMRAEVKERRGGRSNLCLGGLGIGSDDFESGHSRSGLLHALSWDCGSLNIVPGHLNVLSFMSSGSFPHWLRTPSCRFQLVRFGWRSGLSGRSVRGVYAAWYPHDGVT